jgi:hypothetical protein
LAQGCPDTSFYFVPSEKEILDMKKLLSVALALITCLWAVTAMAGSAGGIAPAVGKVNVPLTVPKATKTVCQNTAATTLYQFDVSKTTMVNWASFSTSDGSAVVVKRSFDGYSSSYFPTGSEKNLPIEPGVTKLNIKSYATTGRLCVELN